MGEETLPEPAVPASVYDEEYYLTRCMGYTAWRESDGAEMDPLYPSVLERAGLRDGDTVVDVGTGRGELLVAAVRAGAARAIGLEYSEAAHALAQRSVEAAGVGERAEALLADARAMPVEDATADLVTMLDVVEHLTPHELHVTLLEVRRILRPGGRVYIHTAPNRHLYDVVYRLQRLARPSRWRRWPADPRLELEHTMHVNEMTRGKLRRSLRRAGFPGARAWLGDWLYVEFLPQEEQDGRAPLLYHRLAARRATRWLVMCDLWAQGTRPPA